MDLPNLLVSDGRGNLIEIPELKMSGMGFIRPLAPETSQLMPMPEQSQLVDLLGRNAIGYDASLSNFIPFREYGGKRVYPVACVLNSNHLQLMRTAFSTNLDAPRLAEYNYTAVGILDGQHFVAAQTIRDQVSGILDEATKTEAADTAASLSGKFPGNQIAEYWATNWKSEFRSTSALNFILQRGRLVLPLSVLKSGSHGEDSRKPVQPTTRELIDVAVAHLEHASEAEVCFAVDVRNETTIAEIVAQVRKQTRRGIIEISAHGNNPSAIRAVCELQIDRMVIKLNSLQEEYFQRLHQSNNVLFKNVIESIETAGQFSSELVLHYDVFPGLTDHPEEMDALSHALRTQKINALRPVNLNIDPDWYVDELRLFNLSREQIGMNAWLEEIRNRFENITLI